MRYSPTNDREQTAPPRAAQNVTERGFSFTGYKDMRGRNAHPHKKARKHNTMKKPTTPDLEPAEITMAEDGEMLTIKRNTRTMAAAKRLSDYVNSLELTAEQNNKLVELMIDQTHEAELGAFI